ncbi:MAG: PP0621 family protein [Pigmentiphaga sp.]
MSKILFWVVIILAVLLVSRLLARHAVRRKAEAPPRKRRGASAARPQAMVQCAHCGVHLPAADAVKSQGQTWCSTEHARLGPR